MCRTLKTAISVSVIMILVLEPATESFGRGGRGGGGRGGGMRMGGGGGGMRMGGGGGGMRMGGGGGMHMGGGNMSRPSMGASPSFSRPNVASRPAGGMSRPAASARPGVSRPSPGLTPGSRPGTVDFARSSARPSIDRTPGLTPGTRPGVSRPGVGDIGARPGIGDRPGISDRPGIADRPGVATRPAFPGGSTASLPGLGNRPGADGGRPGLGEGRPGERGDRERGDRLDTPQQRRDNLQDRLASRDDFRDRDRGDRQDRREDFRDDRQDRRDEFRDDRQDRRDEVREDWQDHHDDFYNRHDDWHHGYWHGNYGNWWNHMWDDHTALMAFGTTMWGINRAAYGFGYWDYSNPFYTESYPVGGDVVLNYSQPLAVESAVSTAPSSVVSTPAPSSDTSTAGMSDFEAAKQSFYRGDYASALASTNKALAALPGDPIIHEFRALVLFAQGKYQESAAGLYSVLAVGPGWDWTTLSSLYPNAGAYTKQFRALEAYIKQHPDSADARFVLAYHYITTGSKDAAAEQLKKLHKELPQDRVIKELLVMTAGPEALGSAPAPTETAAAETAKIDAAELVGDWMAVNEEAKTKFDLQLGKDGTFSWTFTEQGKPHNVKGVYALDRNVLAMEPSSGGVMLAEVTPPEKDAFSFKLLGAPADDEGLKFEKSR